MESTVQSSELLDVFGANVKARRKERKLTQQALADIIGVSQPRIAQIEAGSTGASVEMLAPLAAALATTPDALLTPNIFSAVPT